MNLCSQSDWWLGRWPCSYNSPQFWSQSPNQTFWWLCLPSPATGSGGSRRGFCLVKAHWFRLDCFNLSLHLSLKAWMIFQCSDAATCLRVRRCDWRAGNQPTLSELRGPPPLVKGGNAARAERCRIVLEADKFQQDVGVHVTWQDEHTRLRKT